MGVLESRPYRVGFAIVLLLVSSLIFLYFSPPWTTPGSATAIYSVLAFLCITITVCAISVRRTDPAPAHDFFVAGLSYASIIFSGAAIFYIFTEETAAIHVNTPGIFLNLVAFATTGVIMLLYSYYGKFIPSESLRWNSRVLTTVIISLGTFIFIIAMVISRLPIPNVVFLITGYCFGILSIITYAAATILTFQQKVPSTHDSRRLTISFLLLCGAAVNHTLILAAPTSQWLLSMVLMGISFILAIMAIGSPFLNQIGVRQDLSFAITVGLSAIVILPFIFTYLIEISFSFVELIDIGASVIIHSEGIIFAIALAYALFYRYNLKPTSYHAPIILVLVSWAVAETYLAALTVQGLTFLLDANIPYLIGGSFSLVFISQSVRKMLKPGGEVRVYPARIFLLAGMIFAFIMYLGLVFNQQIQPVIAVIIRNTLSSGLLLCLTFGSLFSLLTFILIHLGVYGEEFTFDTMAAGSSTIWLVVMVLKANFSTWSPGWWTAETLMGICFVIFPVLLMKMYLEERTKADEFRERTGAYTGYLGGKLKAHETQISDALNTLTKDTGLDPKSLDVVSKAMQDLSKIESATRNLDILISAEKYPEDKLEPTDLIESIQFGLLGISETDQEVPVVLDGNRNLGNCFVSASPLLSEAFYQLFVGAIRRIGVLHTIFVDISPRDTEPKTHWYCSLNLELSPAELVDEHDLFTRYTSGIHWKVFEFAYAQRIVTLFGGYIQSGSTSTKDTRLLVNFELIFPYIRNPRDDELE